MGEKNLDFDKIINRRGTGSLKYDSAKNNEIPEDVIPLWVADMDFKTSSYIEEVLISRAEHGIFGYSIQGETYFTNLKRWMLAHHGWEVEKNWLVKTPGVVCALAMAVKAYSAPGDAVMVQLPVYYPFFEVIKDNGRRVVSSDLRLDEEGKYQIDIEDFERKIIREKIKIFLLCNPHNPCGRVWTQSELEKIGDICLKNKVIVVSDEIHQDFVFKGKHTVFASLKKEYEKISITCTSPSKTFNLAGLIVSNIFIADEELKIKYEKEMRSSGIHHISVMGADACEAAYANGEEWYAAVFRYISDNINFIKGYVSEKMPGVRMTEHEGTYLVWLDFRQTKFSSEELDDALIYDGKVWLDSGRMFGGPGEGFQRINVACPRAVLKEALERIRKIL